MKYVLIYLLSSGQGFTSGQLTFNDLKSCHIEMKDIIKDSGGFSGYYPHYVKCINKQTGEPE